MTEKHRSTTTRALALAYSVPILLSLVYWLSVDQSLNLGTGGHYTPMGGWGLFLWNLTGPLAFLVLNEFTPWLAPVLVTILSPAWIILLVRTRMREFRWYVHAMLMCTWIASGWIPPHVVLT